MKSVFELAYRYVYPAIKRRLAIKLQEMGLTEREVAKILGVSQPLVSRYNSGDRGGSLDVSVFKDVEEMIERIALEITTKRIPYMELYRRLHEVVAYYMAKKYLCYIHAEIDDVDPAKCSICPTIFRTAAKD